MHARVRERCGQGGVVSDIFFGSAGSGHVSEDDEQPMHLCPVDLHKLYHALGGFDVEDRLVIQPGSAPFIEPTQADSLFDLSEQISAASGVLRGRGDDQRSELG